ILLAGFSPMHLLHGSCAAAWCERAADAVREKIKAYGAYAKHQSETDARWSQFADYPGYLWRLLLCRPHFQHTRPGNYEPVSSQLGRAVERHYELHHSQAAQGRNSWVGWRLPFRL